jgi:Fe-S cluster assembly protein SufD
MTTTTEREVVLGPTGSPAERFTSRNPDDFAVPRGREEEWRFTPTRNLGVAFAPFVPDNTMTHEQDLPEGVTVSLVDRDHPLFGAVLTPGDRASALAMAQVRKAMLVSIPADVVLDRPVTLRVTGEPGNNYGHVIVDVGRFSRATVVFEHAGSATVLANVEIIVGDGASFDFVSVQNWDAGAIHLAAHAARVGRDAAYRHSSVTLGGGVVRLVPTVSYAGPGGSAELFGIGFAGDDQHFESRLFVDHEQPNCRSRVLYKNALLGQSARTVWIGDVRIRPAATGTDTYEMNRNLLLSDGARADSVPNLEIETGNIAGAGHASATGRFDDLQLFYLQSRGIPEDTARRLVVRGFFADVVNRIGLPDLEQQIMTAIETRLGYAAELDSETA